MRRHVFTSRHRHRDRRQAGQQQAACVGVGRGHADDQAGCGDNAVIGAQYRGAQSANAFGSVAFKVAHGVSSVL
jgi:hypothetical protein